MGIIPTKVDLIINRKPMSKALFVSEDCHQKVKVLASLEKQPMGEWVEWVINKAYETQSRSRERKGKPIVNL